MLSTKKGKEAYVEPVIESRGYRFTVKLGAAPDPDAAKAGTKLSPGANFRCLMSGSPITGRLHHGRGAGHADGGAADGGRGGGRSRPGLPAAYCGARRGRGESDSRVEARRRVLPESSWLPRRQPRNDEMERPVHAPPACRPDDLLRPGRGGDEAHPGRCRGRGPAGRCRGRYATPARGRRRMPRR